MSRPLLISDCDEVLLHMVSHFNDWLGEEHGIDFAFESGQFADALTYRGSGDVVPEDRVWPLLEAGRVAPVMDSEFPLDEAAAAHRRMESSSHIGKIVLRVGG